MKIAPTFYTFMQDGSWLNLCNTACALAPAVAAHFGEGRRGGVMTLFEPDGVLGVFTQCEVGTPDPAKSGRYYAISLEKAVRTTRYGGTTSWNCERDIANSQYGGAFLIPGLPLLVSFSGWTEIDDIVFLAYVLRRAGILREADVDTVFRWHDNYALELLTRYDEFTDVLEAVSV